MAELRDRQRPADCTFGVTRRRMSAMLCVICATSGSVLARCAHSRQPDADLDALAEPRRGQRRERLARQLAVGLGLRALAVADVLAERGQHLGVRASPAARPTPPGGRTRRARRRSRSAGRATGPRRARSAAAACGRRPRCAGAATGSSRAPNGSVGVGWVGCVRPSPADPHAAAQRLGAEARQPPAGVDVAAQPARQRARDPAQRAGQDHALAVGRARVAAERASAMSEVRS